MKSEYPKIFEPITIKRTTIKNRIAMTPMGTNYGETSGEMSNRHMNYYSLRAKGGTPCRCFRIFIKNRNGNSFFFEHPDKSRRRNTASDDKRRNPYNC